MVPLSLSEENIVSTTSPPVAPATTVKSVFSQFSLASQVAVVTGGAQGLGYAMAASLCSAGLAGIAILDVNPVVGEAAAVSLQKAYGTSARFYRTDVTDEFVMKTVFAEINTDFGAELMWSSALPVSLKIALLRNILSFSFNEH
ncbi:hypothetical protein V1508DRAFT_400644 [Lipomyces doorenjongii]|uniref:uncharacterized protein n=1 Tax=Lipomyces doorenjongii TaxID=383834 RepID=UPI0034CE24BD